MVVGSGMSVTSLTPTKMRNACSDHTPVNIVKNIIILLLKMLLKSIMLSVASIQLHVPISVKMIHLSEVKLKIILMRNAPSLKSPVHLPMVVVR